MSQDHRLTGNEALAILNQLQAEGHVSEALVQEKLAAVRKGIHADTHARVETTQAIEEKRELEPEQIEQFIVQLRANFISNGKEFPDLHPDTQWPQVEATLRAQPEMMWSLSKMEETGGKVDVIEEDDGSFLFADTSIESPDGRRNVVFDAVAEAYVREQYPTEEFNGNAEDRVKEWGVEFMDEAQYKAIQKRGNFDAKTWNWLKTPPNVRAAGTAFYGGRNGGYVRVDQDRANFHAGNWGFRCALRVLKKT